MPRFVGQAVRVDRQRLLGDVAELAQRVARRRAGLAAGVSEPERPAGGLREEVGDRWSCSSRASRRPGSGWRGTDRALSSTGAQARRGCCARPGSRVFETRTRSSRSRNSDFRFGESWRTLRSVGLMSLATGCRSWTSGRVFCLELVEAVRASACVSRSNVGSDLEEVAQRRLLGGERVEGLVRAGDRGRRARSSRSLSASKTVPVSRTRPCSCACWRRRTRARRRRRRGTGRGCRTRR